MQRPLRPVLSVGSVIIIIAAIVAYLALQPSTGPAGPGSDGATISPTATASTEVSPTASDPGSSTDAQIEQLYQSQAMDVPVTGSGTVARTLSDDTEGDRHQRFILELDSGLTLLVAHNIDLAPRLDGLAAGDRVGFHGEYVYTEQGGTIHWTHHDPDGSHADGWLEWQGRRYS